ncbi:MAG: hypothetical protein CMJ25_28155 [Phycisphaerae bacterium]|nr:hypothetical protein [Phycisphaerae bacterium]|tara:strand:- start:1251 stop:1946 length:696 start_codon:yes stop_codon:yes gene_type:complete
MNGLETMYYDNGKAVKLHTFLDKNKKKLMDYNVFYIISFNSEKDPLTIKFGVAMKARDSFNRLKSYVISHGKHQSSNKCLGVNLHYLGVTKYNDRGHYTKTRIWRTEKFLKRYFKEHKMVMKDRGSERIKSITIKTIIKIANNNDVGDDIETVIRKSKRNDPKPEHKVGDKIKAQWTSNDVKRQGGKKGWYKAEVIKENDKSIIIKFEDGYEKLVKIDDIPNEIFMRKSKR